MEREKKYGGIKVASYLQAGGKPVFFRVITQELCDDEIGLPVILVLRAGAGKRMPFGIIIEMTGNHITLLNRGDLEVVDRSDIVGWTIPRLVEEDIANVMMQRHPDRFCVPGTFDWKGVKV